MNKEKEFAEAEKRGTEIDKKAVRAKSAAIDEKNQNLVIELANGATLLIPVSLIQGLGEADDEAMRDVKLFGDGRFVHFDSLDLHFHVDGLIDGVFGNKKWMENISSYMAELGRKGGSAKSDAKKTAARENGKRGGRPQNENPSATALYQRKRRAREKQK